MNPDPEPSATAEEEKPAVSTYREFAQEHADRMYALAVLLVGDRDAAEGATQQAFERLWNGLDRGNVLGDVEEVAYRALTRAALQRLGRSSELRGYLPATTADDRQITAAGIVGNFSHQQRAAIYAVVWAQLGYRVAGLAAGVGEARARDLIFSARQEYREARGGPGDVSARCREAAPLLSARSDDVLGDRERAQVEAHVGECPVCQQTAALYEEFSQMLRAMRLPRASTSAEEAARAHLTAARTQRRVPGLGAFLRLALGPGFLVIILIAGLFLFGPCGEASIRTGGGRTSDLVYARESGSGLILVLDSGSGRELSRLPGGILTREGDRLYSAAAACGASGCVTALRVTDTATRETTDVGRVDGRLMAFAVDESRIYLADEDAAWQRLVVFDITRRAAGGAATAPGSVSEAFRPEGSTRTPDGRFLLTLGVEAGGEQRVLVRTSLSATPATEIIPVPVPGIADASVVALPTGRMVVYQFGSGMLYEVDGAQRAVVRSTQLHAQGAQTGPAEPALAVAPDGKMVYAALPGGGIGAISLDTEGLVVARRYTPERSYSAIVVSSDGRMLFGMSGASYTVLDVATGEQLLRRDGVRAAGFLQVSPGD